MLILVTVHKVNSFLFERVEKVGTIRLEEWAEQQIILLESYTWQTFTFLFLAFLNSLLTETKQRG